MKEMGYKTEIINGYMVVLPSSKPRKERPLKKSEMGTGRLVGRLTLEELRKEILSK